MEQNPPSEVNSSTANQESHHICESVSLTTDFTAACHCFLTRAKPIQYRIFHPDLFRIIFSVILPTPPCSSTVCFPEGFRHQNTVRISVLLHTFLAFLILSKNLKNKIYRTIILPVVLYGYETWSLTLREERRLRVFENKVLRRISGPRRDEVTGDWRRLHNEEINDLYTSPNIVRLKKSRRMRWVGHVTRMGEERGVYSVLVGKPEGKRPLERI